MKTKETPYEYYNDKLGIKIKFLVSTENKRHKKSLALISYKALNKRFKSKTCTEKQLRRASLGFDALVSFNSLCQEWRDLITTTFGKPKEEAKQSYFAKHYIADREAFNFYCAHRFGENNERKLEPEVIELYTYNASVLNTVIEVKNNRKAYAKALGGVKLNIWESLSNDVNAFNDVRHDLPTTPDSLRHKVTKYQKDGYKSVISRKYGTRNRAKVSTKEQNTLLEELLKKHQNMDNEQIAWNYNKIAQYAGWADISASTVATYRKKLGLYVYAGQHGLNEFNHNKAMQVKRSRPTSPMLYWTVDGWDAELLYQKDTVNKNGHKVTTYHNRLTMVAVLDPFNDYIIGYAIGDHETPTLIREALKNAINHTKELFGERYKPYQLQTDNYQKANLQSTYEAITKHFTPAKVKNSKAKVIENFFNRFNKKYFQREMVPNWSGHNVNAKKQNQPNDEYLNAIRHQFPNELGCRMQIINAIEKDRAEKVQKFVQQWQNLPQADRIVFPINEFLRVFGQTTGYTNKLTGNGVTPTINGEQYYFDSFDLNLRKYMHVDWCLYYDETDLSQVLAVNAESRNGKLTKVIDTLEFVLEQKYEQPMALYDRKEGDAEKLQEVFDFNKETKETLINRNTENMEILQGYFGTKPKLDTLQKLLIVDSEGQHKDQKSEARLNPKPKKKTITINDTDDYEIIEDYRDSY